MRTLLAPPGPVHHVDTHWYYVLRQVGTAWPDVAAQDLAKFEQAWARYPHMVSRGAEKNFVFFQERLKDEPVTVDKAVTHAGCVARSSRWPGICCA